MMKMPEIARPKANFSMVANAFLKLHREGKGPNLEETVQMFPEFASEIREILPSMLLLEEVFAEPSNSVALNAGDEIGGCIIESELGQGSFGTVYKASQPALSRQVAVKAIKLAPQHIGHFDRFSVECKAMAKLDHPNIVQIHSFFSRDDAAFLIMKLVDGPSLEYLLSDEADYRTKARLENIRADWNSFAKIARGIASGLAHAHSNSIVHRDVKPSNVLLDTNDQPLITDFGLAKYLDHSPAISMTGDIVGTPRYMSPEQLRGDCDARSDIYALGLTLYELATGSQARERIDLQIGECLDNTSFDSLVDMPEGLRKVIERACAYAPEDRYQSADELVIVLNRFLKGQTPDRRNRKRVSDKQFRKQYRRKLCLTALSSIFVCGLGAGIWRTQFSTQASIGDYVETVADTPPDEILELLQRGTRQFVEQASDQMDLDQAEKSTALAKQTRCLRPWRLQASQNSLVRQRLRHVLCVFAELSAIPNYPTPNSVTGNY